MMPPRCDSVISYSPFGDEPAPEALGLPAPAFVVPADHRADPIETAAKLKDAGLTCVLVPGRAFDRTGTRHGRGGGWYDRFLAALPTGWIKIGVTTPDRISETMLERKSWDIPMDWLAIVEDDRVRWVKV